jgi:DNA repair exonuclease SbcCD ATPase subunit
VGDARVYTTGPLSDTMRCAFAVAALVAVSDASEITPVQKVIEMMNGMMEKGKKEKHDEQVQFAAFKQFCDDTSGEKKQNIADAADEIEVLKADIQQYATDAAELGKKVQGLRNDVATWEGDIKAATKVREIEKADYDTTHADYSESLDALERAIAVLKKQDVDRTQAALTQVTQSTRIPDKARATIEAFLAEDDAAPEGLAVSAPEANAYESRSGGIIAMLEKLLDEFIAERTALEKEEMNSKDAYDMLMQDLKSQLRTDNSDIETSTETKAKKLEAQAKAEGDMGDTSDSMAEDTKYLADLTATCGEKSRAFESRQQLRAEELEAIEKAIEIVSSGAVSGNADKHLPALVQKKTAFAQLRSVLSNDQAKVVLYLQMRAKELNSRVLDMLATRASEDPFAKVKKMIKDLIVKLLEEANEEATHKGWCDTELGTNEHTRKEKTEAVETLTAEIEELEASIAKGTEDITLLSQQVADLATAVSEATKLREAEKEKNTETISDAQEAQTAVAQALTVLKEFYAKAGKATALVQQEPPPVFSDEPYQGMGAESGGIVGMLEVIESDFARLQASTKANEATAEKEYTDFMNDSEIDKTKKTSDIEHKENKKQDEEHLLETKKVDLEGTQKELTAALRYFDKLKPSCVDSGVSYGDRVARREAEIDSLKEALKILNGEDLA